MIEARRAADIQNTSEMFGVKATTSDSLCCRRRIVFLRFQTMQTRQMFADRSLTDNATRVASMNTQMSGLIKCGEILVKVRDVELMFGVKNIFKIFWSPSWFYRACIYIELLKSFNLKHPQWNWTVYPTMVAEKQINSAESASIHLRVDKQTCIQDESKKARKLKGFNPEESRQTDTQTIIHLEGILSWFQVWFVCRTFRSAQRI